MPSIRSRLWLAFAYALLMLSARADTLVRLASDDWCPYVCAKDGRIVNGVLVDFAQQVLSAKGYRLESQLMPLNRAMLLTEQGKIDGIYAPAIDDRLVLSRPILSSRACFYTRPDSNWAYQSMRSLDGVVTGAIDDYGYDNGPFDDFVARAKQTKSPRIEINRGETAVEANITKLLRKRYDVMIEHEAVLDSSRVRAIQSWPGNCARQDVWPTRCRW